MRRKVGHGEDVPFDTATVAMFRKLHQAVPEAYVEVNRADATAMGLQTGQKVRLATRRGSLDLVARVDGRGRTPRGSLFVPFFDEHKLINQLTLDELRRVAASYLKQVMGGLLDRDRDNDGKTPDTH